MRTVSWVGLPSSSTLMEPRRLGICPLSTTVTLLLATFWPMRPAKAEVFLRLKSASRPWPTASCSRTPGHPGPRTTGISPAGAAMALSCRIAVRAASRAKCSGEWAPSKKSRVTRPPPPLVPRVVEPAPSSAEASFAMTKTLRRARGCVSEAKVPSDAAMRMRRSSSLKPARTCVMRGSKSRAARSARWMREQFGGDLRV